MGGGRAKNGSTPLPRGFSVRKRDRGKNVYPFINAPWMGLYRYIREGYKSRTNNEVCRLVT